MVCRLFITCQPLASFCLNGRYPLNLEKLFFFQFEMQNTVTAPFSFRSFPYRLPDGSVHYDPPVFETGGPSSQRPWDAGSFFFLTPPEEAHKKHHQSVVTGPGPGGNSTSRDPRKKRTPPKKPFFSSDKNKYGN